MTLHYLLVRKEGRKKRGTDIIPKRPEMRKEKGGEGPVIDRKRKKRTKTKTAVRRGETSRK